MLDDAERTFQLDDEQIRRVEDCLRKDGVELPKCKLLDVARTVAVAMDTFRKDKREHEMTFREIHDALRSLSLLANEMDPPSAQIRARIERLPDQVLKEIDRLAPQVIPKLFKPWPALLRGGSTRTDSPPDEIWPRGGFREWARSAQGEKLVRAVQVLAARGGVIVPGRSRGHGNRSRSRIEPYVMNVARGAVDQKRSGGRPSDLDFKISLIGRLADPWQRFTGTFPKPGRSDHTGFGDLVHSVFQWLGASGPSYALREWWKEIRRTEERWVRRDPRAAQAESDLAG